MTVGKVIIGANYGDEGKGLFTDYFANQAPDGALVVRFNGGAQAGHTVVTPDQKRHVFSHFGSGSFTGTPTFLSKYFIVNPLIFVKELREVIDIGIAPQVTIDANAMLTTPFDIFINQSIERSRGTLRHGSCGLGINETVTRSLLNPDFRMSARDMLHSKLLLRKLHALKTAWFPQRLSAMMSNIDTPEYQKFLSNIDSILDAYIRDTQTLLSVATIIEQCPKARYVIFEGAQGLMLDEDRKDQFPHVTRSKTGLTNVLHLAPQFGIDKLDVTYASRTYMTRHGAGPLVGECDWQFTDTTNVPNQYQGVLRFAPLNISTLQRNIEIDLAAQRRQDSRIHVSAALAFTCADQMPIPDKKNLFLPVEHISYGPTRLHIETALIPTMR